MTAPGVEVASDPEGAWHWWCLSCDEERNHYASLTAAEIDADSHECRDAA